MARTQGRPTEALLHGGGVVREIEIGQVAKALADHDLPNNAETVETIWRLLRDRLVTVDAPPATVRHNPQALGRIERAAQDLLTALSAYHPLDGDLLLSIGDDVFETCGYSDDGSVLVDWLLRLSNARERYFYRHEPTNGYHGAIVQMRDAIKAAGGNVALHPNSRLVRFLSAVEAVFPALIFPVETTNTPRGRYRYVENAVKGYRIPHG